MLPLTEKVPKVLVPVRGKPFLWHVLQQFQYAGFKEFVIIAGYLNEKIKEFVMHYNINAVVVEQKEQLGTAHALMQAKRFCGKEQFVVAYGDNLYSMEDLRALTTMDFTSCIYGKEVENSQKYGVLVMNGNKLVRIVEKPSQFVGSTINVGLYKFTPEIWTALDKIDLSPRGEYELTDAVSMLALHGTVIVKELRDFWLDFGCKEDIPKLEGFLKENGIVL